MLESNPDRARAVRSIVVGVLMTGLFMVTTVWILLAANGYLINLRTVSVERRSLISLDGSPPHATSTVDGQLVGTKLPTVIRNVVPGQHAVRVSAPGYHDWELTTKLSSGQAVVRDAILLFRTTPVEQAAITATAGVTLVDPSLSVSGGEVSLLVGAERRLITRFSQPVLAARLSNDRAHVYVQLGSQVLVTELDGANTTELLTLGDTTPALIVPSGHDSVLTIQVDGTLRSWQIR